MKLKKVQPKAPPKKKKEKPIPVVIQSIPGLEREDITPKKYPGRLKQDGRITRVDYIITLDTASMRYVWEMLEVRAHADYAKLHGIPAVGDACRDSINAFRNSYAMVNNIDKPKNKRLKKKATT